MRNLFLLLFVTVLVSSCKNDSKTEVPDLNEETAKYERLNEMKWLLGKWVNEEDGMISKEHWSQKNESTYIGMSFRLLRKDTVFAEKMVLQEKDDAVIMTVSTMEGNKEVDPVRFKLVSSNNKKFEFENNKNDFPKRIIYTNPKKNKIHAWIEGDVLGEKKKIDFHYSRKE